MAKQEKHWQEFYEGAWQARAEILREYLGGGLSPMQALGKFEAKERKEFLAKYTDGSYGWILRAGEKNPCTNTPQNRQTSLSGAFVTIPYYNGFDFISMLVDVIDTLGPFDSIMELGSGLGRNLIRLFNSGAPINVPYFGGEFTKSGVAIGQELADAQTGMNAKFFHFNHLEPKLDIKAGEHAFVFTSHTIEQVTQIPNNWFEVVASIAPKVTCMHLEPFGFQAEILGPASETHKKFFEQNKWNQNMFEVMKAAHKNGTIHIKHLELECALSDDAANPSSIAIWQSY